MNIGITGGTGFVGRHLARALVASGHTVRLIARGQDRRDEAVRTVPGATMVPASVADPAALAVALAGCDAVAHCAGINREIGSQTYRMVHVEGTRHVVEAADRAGVRKVVLQSFLRARPGCGSGYHESKWAAEEIVRASGLDYTIVKAGVVYGTGDHFLDHTSHALHTLPVFAAVGFSEKPLRPVAVADLVRILEAALVGGRLSRQTLAVTGPEELRLSEAIRRIARIIGRRVLIVPAPVWTHRVLARAFERTMAIPLVSLAQVRILSEGVVEPAPPCPGPPDDLAPRRAFRDEQIRQGLPAPGRFGLKDLRCSTC
jgi:NADH dehydrogenase